jgi:hypothetical protein
MEAKKILNIKVLNIAESKGKSRKIKRREKIVYRDRIIYKNVCLIPEKKLDKKDNFGFGKKCKSSEILTQNLKAGDRDGKYSN